MSSYVSSNWRGPTQDNGPRAKCDQVVFEAVNKAAEIIVASRGGAVPVSSSLQQQAQSSRFNLQVPEVAGVRSILQRSRRALHVPLRLDVYYQHDEHGERRELLERWCLEYVPNSSNGGTTVDTLQHQERHVDPIAQLRHVCKRIVIWLRTLYCSCRLLPAQAFQTSGHVRLGFSIYVSDGSDDHSDLVRSQGFLSQQQPSSSVVTPYGELGWRAIYVDKSVIERLLPAACNKSRWTAAPRISTAARPIPIQNANNTNNAHHHHHQDDDEQQESSDRDSMVPQSAPAHMVDPDWHRPSVQRNQSMKSHDPSKFHRSTLDSQHLHPPDLQRRNTTMGDGPDSNTAIRNQGSSGAFNNNGDNNNNNNNKPPERVMSGLSLALMMSDNHGEHGKNQATADPAATEKRRAALHQMPPHLADLRQNQRPSGQGEYGYAYNSHIPWQKIHPSSTNATLGRSPGDADGRFLSTSPSSTLAATPPSGAFLGIGMTPPVVSAAHLIPPRSSVTPPFAPRPAGFAQEPPAQSLSPAAQAAAVSMQPDPQQQQRFRPNDAIPPLAALDLLHSSPFQQPQGSLVSSLSMAPQPGSDSAMLLNSGDLRRSLWSGGSAIVPSSTLEDDAEEMPFAVDMSDSSGPTSAMNTSSQLGASAIVASFAHKCTMNNRLKMFDSAVTTTEQQQQQQSQQPDNVVSALADQLAEFKSFGASLQLSTVGGGSSEHDASASSSTPISLRT